MEEPPEQVEERGMLERSEPLPEGKCLQVGDRSKIARGVKAREEKERVDVGEKITERPERLDER
jgi:hypothetical protein